MNLKSKKQTKLSLETSPQLLKITSSQISKATWIDSDVFCSAGASSGDVFVSKI